jgi:hypothetical protein
MTHFTRRSRVATIGAAVGAIGLLLAVALPAQATNPPEPDRASLVGRVTNAYTGRAIDGATVRLTPADTNPPDPDSNPPEPDKTNHGGHFLFKGLAEGDYSVSATADGYQPYGGPGVSGDVAPHTVHISSSGGAAHFDIQMLPSPTSLS